jgi:hypothetical protein
MSATFGNLPNVVRTFTIPAGKTLFLPVYPWIFGAAVFDCEPSNPGVPCDISTLREAVATAATSIETMEVSMLVLPFRIYAIIAPTRRVISASPFRTET